MRGDLAAYYRLLAVLAGAACALVAVGVVLGWWLL